MVTKAQLRILAWLNRYPESTANAWDVTREISLPGIAEGLGVVRSALNLPIGSLEQSGLVTKRMAHVIGGGTRRRHVFHITSEGRLRFTEAAQGYEKPPSRSEIIGQPPIVETVFGRAEERQECLESLENNSLIVTGMAGIGKSALVVSLCQELAREYTIRWANAHSFSDYHSIVKSWFNDETVPRDIRSFSDMVSESKTLLVIDDFNQLSERHKSGVSTLVEALSHQPNIRLILVSRESVTTYDNVVNFKLDALDLASCCMMLGNETELSAREEVAKSLGNHPLALKLYQPEYAVPESSNDVIEFVENVVLNTLSTAQKEQITHLSLEAGLVDANHSIIADSVNFLDEQNLLLWGGNMVQLQHLIRNVVRNRLTAEQRQSGHALLAHHWQSKITELATENYLYHLANSNPSEFIEYMSSNLDSLGQFNSAAIAAIVNSSIGQNNHAAELIYLECKIAAHRFEPDIIRRNLDRLDGENLLEMKFTLAQIEGRIEDCDAMLDDMLQSSSPLERARLLIMLASQCLEDRLPGAMISETQNNRVEAYLAQISLSGIDRERQSVIVAISLIRFSIALSRHDYSTTSEILQSLSTIGSIDETVIAHSHAKIELEKYNNGLIDLDEISRLVAAHCQLIDHKLIAESVKLRLVESMLVNDESAVELHFSKLSPPELFSRSNTSIRYAGRWWLLHSKIYPNKNLTSLRESLMRFRAAGCSNIVSELERKLHAQI